MNEDDARRASSDTTGKRERRRRRVPPIRVWVVLVLAAATISVVYGTDVTRDHAVANVVTLIAAFVAVMALLIWFSFRSGYSRWVRMAPLLGSLAAVAVFAALFEIDHVGGELIPVFAFRFSRKPDQRLEKPRLPGHTGDEASIVDLRTATEHDFPQFLGPNRDLSVAHLRLARDWASRPPQPVWCQEIGAGWSAFSVVGGFAVTMEQRGEWEMVTCYEVTTGELRWAHTIQTRYEAIMAGVGPRATPTIDEGMVYTLGATGRLLCLDGATGRPVWEKDILKEYGVTPEQEEEQVPYGRANSPLVVGELVVVPAGGPSDGRRVSLVAYDKKTGDLVWEGGNRQVAYASPALATLCGVRQILIVNEDYAGGHDPNTGEVLWEHDWPGCSASDASCSQAVAVPPDRVFLSKGYGRGAMLLRLLPKAGGTFDTKVVWVNSRVMRTKFTNVSIRNGYVYGLSDGILECVELQTGRRIWKGGRYRHGQILRVDELLLVLSESGEVFLVEATPDRPNNVLGQFQAVEGMSWNNLALYGHYLLVRNAQQAACYELPL